MLAYYGIFPIYKNKTRSQNVPKVRISIYKNKTRSQKRQKVHISIYRRKGKEYIIIKTQGQEIQEVKESQDIKEGYD